MAKHIRSTGTFFAGWASCYCFISLMQDVVGKDRVIASIRENWIDSSITVPIAIVVLIFSVATYWVNRNEEIKNDEG